jgi:DNA topoisomerase-3
VANVKMLLSTGKTSKIQGFTSKNGKLFDASLRLEDGKVVFDFPNPPPQKAEPIKKNTKK